MENQTVDQPQEKTIARRSRASESRAFDSRKTKERPPIVYGTGSRFNLSEEVLQNDPDHRYTFVVYSSGNVEQKENYYEAMDRGFMPVHASEHPDLARNYSVTPFSSRDESDDLIRRGGQVLMKRPMELHEAENARYESENHRQQAMAEAFKQTDPRFPGSFMDLRTRGRRGQ